MNFKALAIKYESISYVVELSGEIGEIGAIKGNWRSSKLLIIIIICISALAWGARGRQSNRTTRFNPRG